MNIEKVKTAEGIKYRGRFSFKNSTFRSQRFTTEQEAKHWGIKTKAALIEGRLNSGSEQTLNDFAKQWLEKYAYARKVPAAADRDEQHLRIHVLPKLGKLQLRKISRDQVDTLYSGFLRNPKLSVKTANNILSTMKVLFNCAVEWNRLSISPAAGVKMVKLIEQEPTIFYDEEIRKMLTYAKCNFPQVYQLILFAVNTGCRLGECLGLRWHRVNLTTGFATICEMFDRNVMQVVPRTKGKRFRSVPLNQPVKAMLRELSLQCGDRDPAALIFGGVVYQGMTQKTFQKILKGSGCQEALDRGASFHSLRHTFASRYMRGGQPIYDLQKILGHKSVTQTEKYAHWSPTHLHGKTESVSIDCGDENVIKAHFKKEDFQTDLPENLPGLVQAGI